MAVSAPGQLMWTVLPAGWAADGSQTIGISLVVTPQLVAAAAGATMADFAAFNGATLWPDLMKAASFVVTFNGLDPTTLTPNPAAIDSTLWKLVFPDSLAVAPFTSGAAATVAAQTTQSYSVQTNLDTVLEVIHQPPVYGGTPGKPPPSLNALPLAKLVPDTEAERATLRAAIGSLRAKQKVVKPSHFAELSANSGGRFTPAMIHFAEMDDYYSRLSAGAAARYNAATENQTVAAAPLVPPALDFHAALLAISRYPALMRALGLILDFTLPASDIVVINPASTQMAMAPVANPALAGYAMVSPLTAYTLAAATRTFCLASAGAVPDLANGYFAIPADAAVPLSLRLEALANQLPRLAAQFKRAVASDAAAVPPTLPAPNTAGLALARSGENGLVVTLSSMLEAQAALATSTTPASPAVSAETLVRGFRVDIQPAGATQWFSLHARTGTCTFAAGGRVLQWNDEGWVQLQAFNPELDGAGASLWTHETIFLWQGWSLSAPRPGKMSGQDGTLLDQSAAGTSNLEFSVAVAAQPGTLPLLRFGSSYTCRLRAVDLAGYSLPLSTATAEQYTASLGTFRRYEPAPPPVLLMRDAPGPGESNAVVALRSDIGAPAAGTAERLIAPPSTSLHMAEWHGALDANGALNPGLFSDSTFVARLNASFSAAPYGTTPPAVPYLPDPVVTGAVLDFTPTTKTPTDPVTTLAFDGTWPALNSSRLILAEGPVAVTVDAANHTVTVSLPKGASYTINLTAGLGAGALPLFDYWSQIASGKIRVPSIPQAQAGALNGRTASLTPPRVVTLVHAVQRPLIVSAFSAGTVMTRATGATVAAMEGAVTIDGVSTGKVEILAAWQEWVDNGIDAPYQQSYQSSVVRGTALPGDTLWNGPSSASSQTLPPIEQEFHDVKARRVTYTIVTTTRFMEFFPASITDDPANVTQTSLPLTLDVPCAWSPPAPKVLYVIPLFGWQQQTDASGNPTQTRSCGVRVYLDRPWYASGDGEQLGVVIPVGEPGAAGTVPPEVPAAYVPYVTQWGVDPAFGGAAIPSPFTPLPQHFPGGTLAPAVDAFAFPDNDAIFGDTGIAMVAFPVQFEPPDPANPAAPGDPAATANNGRWYADIEIETGQAYFPFLRLALARYQTYNGTARINACSQIVLADFVQIAPSRSLNLIFDATQPLQVDVVVTGPQNPNRSDYRAQIEVNQGTAAAPLWIQGVESTLVPVIVGGGAPQVSRRFLELPYARGSRPMRIVVREYETWQIDAPGRVAGAPTASTAQRLVFVDSVSL